MCVCVCVCVGGGGGGLILESTRANEEVSPKAYYHYQTCSELQDSKSSFDTVHLSFSK